MRTILIIQIYIFNFAAKAVAFSALLPLLSPFVKGDKEPQHDVKTLSANFSQPVVAPFGGCVIINYCRGNSRIAPHAYHQATKQI